MCSGKHGFGGLLPYEKDRVFQGTVNYMIAEGVSSHMHPLVPSKRSQSLKIINYTHIRDHGNGFDSKHTLQTQQMWVGYQAALPYPTESLGELCKGVL